jgi:hypothetical protein
VGGQNQLNLKPRILPTQNRAENVVVIHVAQIREGNSVDPVQKLWEQRAVWLGVGPLLSATAPCFKLKGPTRSQSGCLEIPDEAIKVGQEQERPQDISNNQPLRGRE